MIERRLKTVIVIYLWAGLVEDTALFVMAWIAPDIWFRSSTLAFRPVLKTLSCAARPASGPRSRSRKPSRFGVGRRSLCGSP
jgi:hypothetical protein